MIELVGIEKRYGGLQGPLNVLTGVNLEVVRGEIVAITGASGSGKSTLLHIIGCLDVPSAGEYRLEGTATDSLDDNQRSALRSEKIGFIFQNFHLIPHLSALENVLLPVYYAKGAFKMGDMRSRAYELLRFVGLEARSNHRPRQLSGGEQQRVAIARALLRTPPLILADEPTGNLDSRNTDQILELLQQLSHTGSTMVLVTHDEHVAAIADRVCCITDGRLVC